MAEQKESFIEKVLRSVLISSKGGVPLQKLNNEFKELLGQDIPYKDNGFPSLEAYLRSMPKVVSIRRDHSGQITCHGVANEETEHLDRLVKKQKSTKKKGKPARLPRFSTPANRQRRPPPHNFRGNPHQQQHPHHYQNGKFQQRRPDQWSHPKPPQKHGGQNQWNQPPPQRKKPPPPQQTKPQPQQKKPQYSQQQTKHHPQHSSSYEVPPRFRRQLHSTGDSFEDRGSAAKPQQMKRSNSATDSYSSGTESVDWTEGRNGKTSPGPPEQPNQPPPVDDKVVSWVNEVLADKSVGLWLSGLKKLYREEFKKEMDDDLVDRLSRLSLWTADEIPMSNDSILYPKRQMEETESILTADLRQRAAARSSSHRCIMPAPPPTPSPPSYLVHSDKILYPNLRVEVSNKPSSGRTRRNVSSVPSDELSVPALVLPEDELWDVYVSYVINVMDFYCIIVGEEYSERLCLMEDEMREFYQSDYSPPLEEEPVPNGLYAAQLSDDWLRVCVIAVEDQVACFLVDHGDIESVPMSDLRPLDHSFYQLPFQAIPCELHNLELKAKSEKATLRFCNTALAETRLAEVISREPRVSLTLYKDRLNINHLCALGDWI
ncbi:tudor domain-containing protein 7B-like [Diadema antillarum]|uniref:tudor domain-containing protein 7B-like n=1 Tax=Diadema antillarum TaxID=105358 RepID=UPI003A8525AC